MSSSSTVDWDAVGVAPATGGVGRDFCGEALRAGAACVGAWFPFALFCFCIGFFLGWKSRERSCFGGMIAVRKTSFCRGFRTR